MVIEESVLIEAGMDRVWRIFTDLACWRDWNRTARQVSSVSGRIEEGERFRFRLRPFNLPVNIDPVIDEVVEHERVVWSGSRFGIYSRHEFLFRQIDGGVLVTSREEFRGIPLRMGGRPLTGKVARGLVVKMLQELKKACEEEQW
jgi:hypothetical protein